MKTETITILALMSVMVTYGVIHYFKYKQLKRYYKRKCERHDEINEQLATANDMLRDLFAEDKRKNAKLLAKNQEIQQLKEQVNKMKKTAVEWLVVEAMKLFTQAMTGTLNEDTLEDDVSKIIIKAKEMEKEKHLNWNKFLEIEKILGISDVKTIERVQWYYNEYYNKTFKSE